MATEIWQAALLRLDPTGKTLRPHGLGGTLTQFDRREGVIVPVSYDVMTVERPPMVEIRGYASRAAS
jgi:hypothetical protein